MKVVKAEPILDCSLDELWDEFWSKSAGLAETLKGVEVVFRGDSGIKPKFRIPAADGGSELFFDNGELLRRFANFPLPTQERFLLSVRQAMAKHEVTEIVITIPWSKQRCRKLRVIGGFRGSQGGPLDFEIMS